MSVSASKSLLMVSMLWILALISPFDTVAQTESAARSKIDANLPTNGSRIITAAKLREAFDKVLDYSAVIDSLTKTKPTQAAVNLAIGVKADTSALSAVANSRTPYATSVSLRAGSVGYPAAVILTDKQGGTFRYNSANTTSADDSAMVIRIGNRRYERVYERVRPEFWGGNPNDNVDDSYAMQRAANFGAKDIYLSPGTWLIHGVDLKNSNVTGASSGNTIVKVNGGTEAFILGYDDPHWRRKVISHLTIDGDNRTYNGVRFYLYTSTEISGRWTFDDVRWKNCDKGIYKPNGNIGNVFNRCLWQGNNYGYYAVGTIDPFFHAGFDTFDEPTFESNLKACVYIDSPTPGTGGTVFNRPHFESNPGFLFFIKEYTRAAYTPLEVNQMWSEINATADSVNIDGVNYKPKDVYLRNCGSFVFTNSAFGSVEIINSIGSFDNSLFVFNGYAYKQDSLSVVNNYNIIADGVKMPFLTHSIKRIDRSLGNFGIVLNVPHRTPVSSNYNSVLNIPFTEVVTLGGGTANNTGTLLSGGPTLDNYNRYTMPPNNTHILPAFAGVAGRYYVLTMAMRKVSDQVPSVFVSGPTGFSNGIQSVLKKGKFQTVATVGKCETSGSYRMYFVSDGLSENATFDLQAMQVVEFYTEAEALEYFNSGIFGYAPESAGPDYSTAIPKVKVDNLELSNTGTGTFNLTKSSQSLKFNYSGTVQNSKILFQNTVGASTGIGLLEGGNNAVITQIVNKTASVSFGTVAAQSTTSVDVTISEAVDSNYMFSTQPTSNVLASGLVWNIVWKSSGTVTIRMTNVTSSGVVVGTQGMIIHGMRILNY